MSQNQEFHLAEFAALRQEITTTLQEAYSLEKFALTGAAGIAAYLATHAPSQRITEDAWWLPAILLTLCGLRFAAAMWHVVDRVGPYIRHLELTYLGKPGGFETYFSNTGVNQTLAHGAIWSAALGLAIGTALIQERHIHIPQAVTFAAGIVIILFLGISFFAWLGFKKSRFPAQSLS